MADVISNDTKLTIEKDKKPEEEKNELSEEDKALQDELNLLVERLVENDVSMHEAALSSLRDHIRASTTSMTSVPKPLKFMRIHYDTMKGVYEKLELPETKKACADIVSVLAMTMSEGRDCLKYRLKGSLGDIGLWGHEYVRQLAGEIAAEWAELVPEDTEMKTQLMDLAREIVPYNMAHNAEAETCDLLMEIERLDLLEQYVDESAYPRVCLYLTSCVPYVPDPENTTLLQCALRLFKRFGQYPQALVLAMQLNDMQLIESVFTSCKDLSVQKQLAYMLGRQKIFLELNENVAEYDELVDIMSNAHLASHFINLARELDIMEPKTPEDVYKSHLENSRPSYGGGQIDSARQNLAASFVNGFVNAAFERDKVLMEDGNKWLYKNKDHVSGGDSNDDLGLEDQEALEMPSSHAQVYEDQQRASSWHHQSQQHHSQQHQYPLAQHLPPHISISPQPRQPMPPPVVHPQPSQQQVFPERTKVAPKWPHILKDISVRPICPAVPPEPRMPEGYLSQSGVHFLAGALMTNEKEVPKEIPAQVDLGPIAEKTSSLRNQDINNLGTLTTLLDAAHSGPFESCL